MKLRTLALLLAVVMVLGLMAGCGGSATSAAPADAPASEADAPEAGAPEAPAAPAEEGSAAEVGSAAEEIAAEPEDEGYVYTGEWATYPIDGNPTLTMWCEYPGFLAMVGLGNTYVGFSTWAAAEEATGVHIEFTEVGMDNAAEQFSLMCAANDMKDLLDSVGSYYGSTAAAVEDEIAIDLAEYAEEYMGNYMTILNDPKYHADKENAYNSEGQLVAISSISDDFKPQTGVQLRKDWLDEQGLDVPETYDDLEKVLIAFHDAYNCSDTLFMSSTQETDLIAGYGTAGAAVSSMGGSANNMYVVDGEIRNGYQDESYKAYLTMMNKWYSEGLLSPDFITRASSAVSNNMDGYILDGSTGVWLSQGNFIDQYMLQADDPNFEVVGIANPYSPEYNDGKTTHFTSSSGAAGGGHPMSVSTNCEDVELACKYLDYFWTEEGILLCNYGIEGEGFDYNANGEPEYSDMVKNGMNFQFMMVGYTLSGMPSLQDFDRAFFTYSDAVLSAFDTWAEYTDDAYVLPSAMTLSTDQSEEYSRIFGDLNTMAEERVGRFITGDLNLESDWDTFQEELESMGIQDCIDIYQEAYDDFMASHS